MAAYLNGLAQAHLICQDAVEGLSVEGTEPCLTLQNIARCQCTQSLPWCGPYWRCGWQEQAWAHMLE